GIVPMLGITEAMDAIEAAVTVGAAWAKSAAARIGSAVSPPSALPEEGAQANTSPDEAAAKSLLAWHGLPVPAGHRAATADEAVAAAEALGYPIAIKALGVAHKSEAGAVRLNLADPDSVRNAAQAMAGLGTG